MAVAHQAAQATCRLGIAAYRFTKLAAPCGWAAPRMSRVTRMSVIPRTENRGGAAGQAQNTTFATAVARTSADPGRPNPAGLRTYSQARRSPGARKWTRPEERPGTS